MIHENGYAEAVDPANPEIIYDDAFRTNLIMQYLEALNLSIRSAGSELLYVSIGEFFVSSVNLTTSGLRMR
ncbi:hypothetical protein FCM35_KLT07622 [Carex littledalei]|uniref:Uncharacterized protein n=1 Tax=Carex littledalei TaxID=544730 RepID=A0A833QQP5_9POAL|nr:hypothetical protein FCM35_KLT07622 [Carex littledalei]